MASFGHSGSQTSQLMHSSVIINDMVFFLLQINKWSLTVLPGKNSIPYTLLSKE